MRWLRTRRELLSVGPASLAWWDPADGSWRRRPLPDGAARLSVGSGHCGIAADGSLVLHDRGRLSRLRSGSMDAEVAVDGLTIWLRQGSSVAGVATFDALELGILGDEGAVVCLSGVEVVRGNIPSGPLRGR